MTNAGHASGIDYNFIKCPTYTNVSYNQLKRMLENVPENEGKNKIVQIILYIIITGLIFLNIGSYEIEEVLIYNYSLHKFTSTQFFVIKALVIIVIFF